MLRNVVTGVLWKNNCAEDVKRMIFGTWDSAIFFENPQGNSQDGDKKEDELSSLFSEVENLTRGVLYCDNKHSISQRGHVRPPSTFNSVRSIATAIKAPQTMSRDKLWMCIQSAIRYLKKLGLLGSFCAKSLLGEKMMDAQDEIRGTGTKDLDMGWEMTILVATFLPPDAELPLPRIWNPMPAPPPKQKKDDGCGCALFQDNTNTNSTNES